MAPCFSRSDPSLPLPSAEASCLAHPPYSLPPTPLNSSPPLPSIPDAVRRTLDALRAAPSVTPAWLERTMASPCARRLCLRLQLIRGELFALAPHSVRCESRQGAPCDDETRGRQEGVGVSTGEGEVRWSSDFSPISLEWDFVAGLNVSSCAPRVEPGDFNGPFSRLRLLSSLRLIEEAARAGLPDTELILCAGETPLSLGGWCVRGPQPLFECASNVAAPSLPYPHWIPRLRDVELALWDDAMASLLSPSLPPHSRTGRWRKEVRQQRKAVFRGGLYRLSVYSDRWREVGPRHSILTPHNWRRVGRTALLHLLSNASHKRFLNVHITLGRNAGVLGISKREQRLMDSPPLLSMDEQERRFRYVLNLEGHGGWADRLYKLLLSRQLVLSQVI